jgi:SAM-dependent methyltransferase
MAKALNAITNVAEALEIGGPSALFEKEVPIYEKITDIEFVNIFPRMIQHYGKEYRVAQAEITQLWHPDNTYDMVLASHVLEHTTNPIRGLLEIWRVLKVGGHALIILPNKNFTFDKNRKITTFKHMLWDFKRNTPEHDMRHMDEIVETFAFELDNDVKNKQELIDRCLRVNHRTMHQHVFDEKSFKELATFCDFKHVETWFVPPWNDITLLRKETEPFQE